MIRKHARPPTTKRRFTSAWGELDYLCKKISYWLYRGKQRANAERYVDRLDRVLHDLPRNETAIVREEALALLHELKGKIDESIAHRRREIELMERLHRDARSSKYSDSTRAYMLRDRDAVELRARRAILESLEKSQVRRNGRAARSA